MGGVYDCDIGCVVVGVGYCEFCVVWCVLGEYGWLDVECGLCVVYFV